MGFRTSDHGWLMSAWTWRCCAEPLLSIAAAAACPSTPMATPPPIERLRPHDAPSSTFVPIELCTSSVAQHRAAARLGCRRASPPLHAYAPLSSCRARHAAAPRACPRVDLLEWVRARLQQQQECTMMFPHRGGVAPVVSLKCLMNCLREFHPHGLTNKKKQKRRVNNAKKS